MYSSAMRVRWKTVEKMTRVAYYSIHAYVREVEGLICGEEHIQACVDSASNLWIGWQLREMGQNITTDKLCMIRFSQHSLKCYK